MGVNSCGTTLIDNGTFKNIGAITWDTTAKTAGFTAVAGNGYFVNTTSGAITVTLPSSPSAGDAVGIDDYANTADTNNITIGRNGSNIQGNAADAKISTEGRSVLLVYVDGTKGWLLIDAAQASDIVSPQYVTATGGTITTCGDFKIHTFTGPGTFCVSNAGNAEGSNTFAYVVVGGGAGGNSGNVSNGGGGGGGGGLVCVTSTPASTGGFPIAVGGGGAGGSHPVSPGTGPGAFGAAGSNSTGFSSTGGGAPIHKNDGSDRVRVAGPSGTPQSNAAGSPSDRGAAGGGGAGGAGGNSPGNPQGGAGGNGLASPLDGATRAGGGGGSGWNVGSGGSGAGGPGGGGAGGTGPQNPGCNATANTGGGGGGGAGKCGISGTRSAGGNGGSGVVIVKYRFQ